MAVTSRGARGGARKRKRVFGADLTPWVGQARLGILGLCGAGLLAGVRSYQDHQRQEILEVLARALSPLIGSPPEARLTAQGWSKASGELTPQRLEISYDPRAVATVKDLREWAGRIADVAAGRLDRPVSILSQTPRQCLLVLEVHPPAPTPEDAPEPVLAARATSIVEHLLGKDAKIECTWEGQRLVALDVAYHLGVRVSANPRAQAHVERTVTTMLPGRWRSRWDPEQDTVRLEVRPEIPEDLDRHLGPVPQEMLRQLPYSVDEDGRECVWDLGSGAGTPHFLIVGPTGTGKTVTIRGIVLEACRRDFQVRICDPKQVEFVGLKGWPNVEIVADEVPAIVAVIHQTWLEMTRRYQLIKTGQATTKDFDPLLLVLDEYRYFYGVVNAWYANVKGTGGSKICPILEEVFLIASLGRTADVHILLGTQRPDADWLGGDVRDQFQARMSMGRLSPQGAQMMWANPQTGTSVPRRKPGRGTTVTPDGEVVEAQSYYTPDPMAATPDQLDMLAALRPQHTTWPRRVVVPLPTEDDNGEPIEEKGRYTAWRDAPYVLASEAPELIDYTPDAWAMAPGEGATQARAEAQEQDWGTDEDLSEEYGSEQTVRAGQLHERSGSLLQIDEQFDLWAVIETVDEDALDSDQVAVCWRSDDDGDDYGVLVLGASELVAVRDPLVDAEDA